MDKKLTDSEIVKALECCAKDIEPCVDCPATDKGEIQCFDIVKMSALDLINRLQAKINRLKENDKKLNEQKNVLVVCWKNSLKDLRLYKAENEKLRNLVRLNVHDFTNTRKKEIKAEAYKEFAERLKEKYKKVGLNSFYSLHQFLGVVDNISKELVGE